MSKGKKIDTWTFEHEGVTARAPVYMHKKGIRDGGGISFSASIANYDIRATNTDADKLRAELQLEFKKRLQIDWQPMLRVCFGGSTQSLVKADNEEWFVQDVCGKLKIRVERLWVGKTPTGTSVYCDNHGFEDRYKSSVRSGAPATGAVDTQWWTNGGTGSDDGTAALIPDTPDNCARVQRIIDGMDQLTSRLRTMLEQDQIETTLQLIGVGPLLLTGSLGQPVKSKKR